MQRILYITDSLVIGGIEAQLLELVTRLDRQRFEPHVACLYGPTARPLALAPALQAAGIPLYSFDLRLDSQSKLVALLRIIALERGLRPTFVQAEIARWFSILKAANGRPEVIVPRFYAAVPKLRALAPRIYHRAGSSGVGKAR